MYRIQNRSDWYHHARLPLPGNRHTGQHRKLPGHSPAPARYSDGYAVSNTNRPSNPAPATKPTTRLTWYLCHWYHQPESPAGPDADNPAAPPPGRYAPDRSEV